MLQEECAWNHQLMTTPAPEPGLSRADLSGAIEGTAMPVDVEQEVLSADGSWTW